MLYYFYILIESLIINKLILKTILRYKKLALTRKIIKLEKIHWDGINIMTSIIYKNNKYFY